MLKAVAPAHASPRPLERAQLVWMRAVALSEREQHRDPFTIVLDLLRAARHGPSTMLHALALGQAQQRAQPDDVPTRDAVRLLSRSIAWLGKRVENDEVSHTATD